MISLIVQVAGIRNGTKVDNADHQQQNNETLPHRGHEVNSWILLPQPETLQELWIQWLVAWYQFRRTLYGAAHNQTRFRRSYYCFN